MQIETLKEYIIVDSSLVHIRIGRRQDDDSWKFEEITETSGQLIIHTINQQVQVTDIYDGIRDLFTHFNSSSNWYIFFTMAAVLPL